MDFTRIYSYMMKNIGKNIYLTDIKVQKGFCVGGLLYRIQLRYTI